MRTVSNEPWASLNLGRDFGLLPAFVVCCAVVLYCALLLLCASVMAPWLLLRRVWDFFCSSSSCRLLLLYGVCLMAVTTEAAPKPEPLTYKLGGRRYVVLTPNSQLWSVVEFARVATAQGDKLFIDGKEVRRARVRGDSFDKFGRNYLVIVMRTGKRLNPPPAVALPMPPAAKMLSSAKSAPKSAQPLIVRLTWDDMPGAIPAGWGATDLLMMPDGGPKFWTVHASRDLRAWRTVAVTTTNRVTIGAVWPNEYYRTHWRGSGAPAEVWP